jgi:hypothetical protein
MRYFTRQQHDAYNSTDPGIAAAAIADFKRSCYLYRRQFNTLKGFVRLTFSASRPRYSGARLFEAELFEGGCGVILQGDATSPSGREEQIASAYQPMRTSN